MARPKKRALHLAKIVAQRHTDSKRAKLEEISVAKDRPEDGFLETTGEEIEHLGSENEGSFSEDTRKETEHSSSEEEEDVEITDDDEPGNDGTIRYQPPGLGFECECGGIATDANCYD